MHIRLLKPFVFIANDGCAKEPHMIAFGKLPVEWKSEDVGNGMARSVVSKYRYIIEINLFLVVLFFHFEK